jgi:hypothetical protein
MITVAFLRRTALRPDVGGSIITMKVAAAPEDRCNYSKYIKCRLRTNDNKNESLPGYWPTNTRRTDDLQMSINPGVAYDKGPGNLENRKVSYRNTKCSVLIHTQHRITPT